MTKPRQPVAQPPRTFTEHRPSSTPAKSATKSDENTANTTGAVTPSGAVATSDKRNQKEIGGPKGPEPTRYGDWERDGRCVDF